MGRAVRRHVYEYRFRGTGVVVKWGLEGVGATDGTFPRFCSELS